MLQKKNFLIFYCLRCLAWDVNSCFLFCKSIHHLLDYKKLKKITKCSLCKKSNTHKMGEKGYKEACRHSS